MSPGPAGDLRGPAPVRRASAAIALSPARARLLEHLQRQGAEVGAEDLADQLGQHPNTVRAHLDALAAAGLVVRDRRPGPGRGRPAWRYRANPHQGEPDPRVGDHAGLVGALAASLAACSPDPRAQAREAGTGWGRSLVGAGRIRDTSVPGQPPGQAPDRTASTPADAHRSILDLLAALDFGPRATRTGVVLTTCPLLDVARAHPDVVCAAHEGMIVGALQALGAVADPVRLTPFGSPQGCLLVLTEHVSGADQA